MTRAALRTVAAIGIAGACVLGAPREASAATEAPASAANEPASGATDAAPTAAQIDLSSDTKAPAADTSATAAPPPPPYERGFVLDSTVGALAFLGKFGETAPPAPWLHTQLGYEVLDWLMFFGEGELAFTSTSRTQEQPKTRAFPIFGFGGGARVTVHITHRVGIYLQGSVGAMKADVAHNALAILGFKNAEGLGLYAAARLGVEWYQVDRHFALGLNGGVRSPQGFKQVGGAAGDTPLAVDGGASIRYAF